jgi:prepilin-type N-terminal cleavage/methylation domain-containing protein
LNWGEAVKKYCLHRRNSAGFTLVEMAIVLIVIALIIGAILKGQDLIANARAKQFAAFIRAGEIAQWSFYDRFGRFAGDGDADGQIEFWFLAGSDLEKPIVALQAELRDFQETLSLGGSTYHVRYGYRTGTNEPILCVFNVPGVIGATDTFSDNGITFAQAFDTIVDGQVDPSTGKVVGLVGSIGVLNGVPGPNTGVGADKIQTTNTWSENTVGLLYFFDSGSE